MPRTEQQHYNPRYGFRMDVPEHLYNFGEVHNLCIERGTLTAEERYKINEHIVQTVVMLDQLAVAIQPLAGARVCLHHHETLAGNRLSAQARCHGPIRAGTDHGHRRYFRSADGCRPAIPRKRSRWRRR